MTPRFTNGMIDSSSIPLQKAGGKMAVPKYKDMYSAFLTCLADGKVHKIPEVREYIAKEMKVSPEARQELLPSGRQSVFANRVGWAKTYLQKAGLLSSPARGCYCLTETGKAVLAKDGAAAVTNNYLSQFASFQEFCSRAEAGSPSQGAGQEDAGQSPQDMIDRAYQQITQNLAEDLLAEIVKRPPAFFERLVVELLKKMGYGGSLEDAGVVLGRSGDEGIDGVIREDKLGFGLIYIQAKCWEPSRTIGRPEIQKFVGALAGQGAGKGLFITTAQFTKEAREYAKKQHTTKVVLVDGDTLSKYMIEFDLGVSTDTVYRLKHLDTDYFQPEEE